MASTSARLSSTIRLTTPESLAGIFNLLMGIHRRILKNKGIYLADKTIEAGRQKYEIAVNPVESFLENTNEEDALASDVVPKDGLYKAYEYFCKKNKLAIMNKNSFGKRVTSLSTKLNIREYREPSGERRTMWQGIRLTKEYENAANGFYNKQTSLV
jgi:Poxvirus D5 protein-like